MSKQEIVTASEGQRTFRLFIFWVAIIVLFFTWNLFDWKKSEPKEVVIRIHHECPKRLVEGKEFISFDCFRAFSAKVENHE